MNIPNILTIITFINWNVFHDNQMISLQPVTRMIGVCLLSSKGCPIYDFCIMVLRIFCLPATLILTKFHKTTFHDRSEEHRYIRPRISILMNLLKYLFLITYNELRQSVRQKISCLGSFSLPNQQLSHTMPNFCFQTPFQKANSYCKIRI